MRVSIQEFQELTDKIAQKDIRKFGEGGESDLYEILGTNLLLRVPKVSMLTDDSLDLARAVSDIYEFLFKLQLPCIPQIIALAGLRKIGLCSQYQTMRKMDEQLSSHFTGQPDEYASARVDLYDSIQVLERIDGMTLADYFQHRCQQGEILAWNEIYYWFKKIVTAVSELHQYGLVHGDLNPTNIMLADHKVYLIDFGRSAMVDSVGNMFSQFCSIAYSPPECYSNGDLVSGAAIDYWALGVILYWLITGTENAFDLEDKLWLLSAQTERAKFTILNSSKINVNHQRFEQGCGQDAKLLCQQLLSFKPEKRVEPPILSHPFFTPNKRVSSVAQRGYKTEICLYIFSVAAITLGVASYFFALPLSLTITALGIGVVALSLASLRCGLFSSGRYHETPADTAILRVT